MERPAVASGQETLIPRRMECVAVSVARGKKPEQEHLSPPRILPKRKRKATAERGHFETEALERLRKELRKQGIRSTRARIPEVFLTAKRDDVTVSYNWTKRREGRPKGKTKATFAKLGLIARLQAEGLTQKAIAEKMKGDKDDLRKYISRYREEFEQVKRQLNIQK